MFDIFDLPAFELDGGAVLDPARLAYRTHGELNESRTNAVLFPTWFAGDHTSHEWLIGPDKALDPGEYFVIVPNLFGNGVSSSPSNTPAPHGGADFPQTTIRDNVRAQHRLVTEHFGIERLALVLGCSMGALQTFQWAVSHPEMVARALPFCGASSTSPHNQVFIESLRATLTLDAAYDGGRYREQPLAGIRAFARVYAGWGFSQAFYREETYRQLGFSSLEEFLTGFWETNFTGYDANDLLAMLRTWQDADVATTPGADGDIGRALGAIKARVLALPAEKDLYFPPEDEVRASRHIPQGEVRVIPGIWGHLTGGGGNPVDVAFIDQAVRDLLAMS
ncbi:homoserine O-acetyltransferase [Microtetraspora sp. NBRC 13810]|uniref:alpha/beta fold hydrolase n=1 Tax=Microtetraspora sp. NBRC 13810 TaxID=3030990 RepID=UPI0024A38975|nr:alpha/beta fold hydrolase [Microtetraspora sp. NBRC 13810]GLW06182.1 homoserine O-acetyltransferase [Microtetraspora sp. NBRC 13810]